MSAEKIENKLAAGQARLCFSVVVVLETVVEAAPMVVVVAASMVVVVAAGVGAAAVGAAVCAAAVGAAVVAAAVVFAVALACGNKGGPHWLEPESQASPALH